MSLTESALKKIFVQPVNYCQNCTLMVRSVGVTARQTYDNITKEFVPDYTDSASMLQIFPQCILVDPDSPVASNAVNAELSDVTWWEVSTKGETKIYPVTNTATGVADGYEVTRSGDSKGEIYVKSNGTVGVPRTLRFKAKWYDTQSGYCYNFLGEMGLGIENASEPMPELVLSIPKTFQWNPFRNPNTYEVAASLFVGKKNLVNDSRCKLFWRYINSDGSKTLITSETDVPTLEVQSIVKNANGQITSMVIALDMVENSSYEVVASFRSNGDTVTSPDDSDPKYQFTVSRSFPVMSAEFRGKNLSVRSDTKSIQLSAIIKDNMDIVPDWERYAKAYWYSVQSWVDQNNTTQQKATLLGTGDTIDIPTTQKNFIKLALEEKGYLKPTVDDSSNYLVDVDGNYIVTSDIV